MSLAYLCRHVSILRPKLRNLCIPSILCDYEQLNIDREVKVFKAISLCKINKMSETNDYTYVFKFSWYESKRHTISHSDMYFLPLINEKVDWFFDKYCCNLMRVQLIRVKKTSQYYKVALENMAIPHLVHSNKHNVFKNLQWGTGKTT